MKIILKFLFILCVSMFFSCKDDASKKENKLEDKPNQSEIINKVDENIFVVKLKVLFSKDDSVEVFYLENESDTYSADRMIQKKIKGMDDFQDVNFNLPKNLYPYNIRLDFGFDKDQEAIKIMECDLTYNDVSFTIKGSELKNYFNFNGGVEVLSDSLTFKLKPFDLHGKEVYDPYIVGNKNLELALMTKL